MASSPKSIPPLCQELGEDPGAYAELREGRLKSLAPQDAIVRSGIRIVGTVGGGCGVRSVSATEAVLDVVGGRGSETNPMRLSALPSMVYSEMGRNKPNRPIRLWNQQLAEIFGPFFEKYECRAPFDPSPIGRAILLYKTKKPGQREWLQRQAPAPALSIGQGGADSGKEVRAMPESHLESVAGKKNEPNKPPSC